MATPKFSDGGWEILDADRVRYREIFQKADSRGAGKLTSQEFRPIFLQSKLSPDELFAIWTLVDPAQSGSLDLDQFSASMHLIFGRIAGKSLPSQLPPGLIKAQVPPQLSEEDRIRIQTLEREIGEKKLLLNQPFTADHQAENQRLKENINLLYTKAPIHHPDFFKDLEKRKGDLESDLKAHFELFNSLKANQLVDLCEEIKQVLKEISKVNLESFKLDDASTHGYTIPSNVPLIPAAPASQDPIAIKAAAMLAQRMQKLNLANTPTLPTDASARIASYTQGLDSDEARQVAELSEASEKISKLSKQFIEKVSSLNQLASDVEVFKEEFNSIQGGAKFTTADLRDLLVELSTKSKSLFNPQPPKQEIEAKGAESFGDIRDTFNQRNDADPFAALISKRAEEASDPFTQLVANKARPQSPVNLESLNEGVTSVATPPAFEEQIPKPSVKDFASLFSNPPKADPTPKEPPKGQQAAETESKPFEIPPPPPPPPATFANPLPEIPPVEARAESPKSSHPIESFEEKFSSNPFGKAELKSNNPFGTPKNPSGQGFKFSVRAIYAYSEERSALKFEVGDILNVTDEGDASAEWYLGHLPASPNTEDWFPRAYVTREMEPNPAQEPPQPTYKLIYEYAPLDDQGEPFGDPLEADARLEVVDDSDADWWLVQDPRPSQEGLIYVPANFLEPVA